MTPQLISIYALVAMFVVATVWPINMGILAFVGAFLVGTLVAGQETSAIIDGFPGGLFLTLVGITYPLRARAEQRHHRLAGPPGGSRGAGPHRRDSVDHVRDLGGPDLGWRRQPRRGGDHRPDRPRLRLPLPDLAAADGPDGGARRAGRRLLADQHLRRHHQWRGRQGRAAAEPDDDVRRQLLRQPRRSRCCCSCCSAAAACCAPGRKRRRRSACPISRSRRRRPEPQIFGDSEAEALSRQIGREAGPEPSRLVEDRPRVETADGALLSDRDARRSRIARGPCPRLQARHRLRLADHRP